MPGDDTKYRLWSVANKNRLVLTVSKDGNDGTITSKKSYDEDDGPEESSNVKFPEAEGGSEAIGYHIVFTHNNTDYALHIEDNTTVTAKKVTDQNSLDQAAIFVPKDTFTRLSFPFVEWKVKSSGPCNGKYIVVNDDVKGSLSVKAYFTGCRHTATFVRRSETAKEAESRD